MTATRPPRAPLALEGTDPLDAEAMGLLALDRAEQGRLGLALSTLAHAWAQHGPADPLVEVLIGLGDAPQARKKTPAGQRLIERQISLLASVPFGPLRTGLLVSIAMLESTQRDPAWAAAWVKRAMAEDPGDPRPWDLLDLLLDADPKLPIDKKTKQQLKALRLAQKGPDADDLAHPEDALMVVVVDPERGAWLEGEAAPEGAETTDENGLSHANDGDTGPV